jgi:diphthamide synthase (EF-2-diphthine--ammonia ligase)
VPLPQPCPNAEYAARLTPIWSRAREQSIDTVIFGDLFLSDIRAWREALLADTGLTPVFPLWGLATAPLAQAMLRGGLEATVCAVDESRLEPRWVGQAFDSRFLAALPPGVDPCGENGEFHTFVTRMPGFSCAASFL